MNAEALAGAVIAGGLALGVYLERFRKTSHGANPWTMEGLVGALWISWHVDRVVALTGASHNSSFRHPRIMQKVYDSKRGNPAQWDVVVASAKSRGVTVDAYVAGLIKGSRHTRGLAGDFSGRPIGALADEIFALAKAGKIGPVKKVLDERDHVHVEWFAPWETVKAPTLQRV
jgi:hypothetical protein